LQTAQVDHGPWATSKNRANTQSHFETDLSNLTTNKYLVLHEQMEICN